MASLPAAEDEYDFVEKPSEDFFCPVTLEFLREPHQMLYCGNHLSPEAVTRLQRQPCPVCKEANLNTVPDKFFKRKVNELKVRCPNKSLGCEWVGEFGNLDSHLSQNSVEGECQFVKVFCPFDCDDSFQRRQLEGHKTKHCPNRPFTCQYCAHKTTYIRVTSKHWPICKQYPLECPNKCKQKAIERQHLPKHLEETCPRQVIKCEFSYAGCEVECQRQHMQTHLEENVKVHLKKVSYRTKQQQSQMQLKIEHQQEEMEKYKVQTDCELEKQQSMNEQLQKQIVALMSALQRVALDVKKPLAPVFVPPPDMVMTDFETHKKYDHVWYSPPFYSHIGGYKMCLGVYANGWGVGESTHVSVFIYLMQGEYDDQLKWPFRGDITIQLLNQSRDEGHWEKTVRFTMTDDIVSDEAAGRVVGKERATKGRGQSKFITHTKLDTENKEYLKYNCLKFRILKFVVTSI